MEQRDVFSSLTVESACHLLLLETVIIVNVFKRIARNEVLMALGKCGKAINQLL